MFTLMGQVGLVTISNIKQLSAINHLIHTANALLIVAVGGALTVLERKFLSTIQRRVGPDLVGHKGRLQFIADAIKILLKEIIYVKNTKNQKLVSLPAAYLILSILGVLILDLSNNNTPVRVEYSIPMLLLILAVSNIVAVETGLLLNNKYTRLATNRAVTVSVLNEMGFGLILVFIVLIYGTFNFSDILIQKTGVVGVLALSLPIVPLIITALMDMGKAPFDIVEAETEIIMGFHSDYSGFLFVLFLLGEYLHMVMLSYLIIILI